MAADPMELLAGLGREVRGVRGGVVLGLDGSVLAQLWLDAQGQSNPVIGLCAGLAGQLQHLTAEAELGRPVPCVHERQNYDFYPLCQESHRCPRESPDGEATGGSSKEMIEFAQRAAMAGTMAETSAVSTSHIQRGRPYHLKKPSAFR